MAANVLIGNGRRRTCKELTDWTNRPAHVLTEGLGVRPGNRVLMRPATAQCVALAASIPTQIFMILPPQSSIPQAPSRRHCLPWPSRAPSNQRSLQDGKSGGKAAGAINDSQNDFHTRLTRALQEHVKATIAPFKYPRSVIFTKGLPKTESGKIQRFRLRPGRDDTQDQTGRNQKGDMT